MTFISSLIGLASAHAPPPNSRGFLLGDEAPGDRFVEPARGRGAADLALDHLRARGGRLGDPGLRGKGVDGDLVVAGDARDFLDQVGRSPSTSRRQLGTRTSGRRRRTSKPSDLAGSAALAIAPAHLDRRPARTRAPRSKPNGRCVLDRRRRRRGSRSDGFAAADVEDQAGQDLQPVAEEGRIDAALEAAAGVAGQARASGRSGRCGPA